MEQAGGKSAAVLTNFMPKGIYQSNNRIGRHWKIKDTSKMKGHSHGFKKGEPPWNKNVHVKLNDALNVWRVGGGSPWNKGKKFLQIPSKNSPTKRPEFRKKMSELAKKRVENGTHNLWKGGVTPINKTIRSGIEYRLWRESVFTRDDWTCQECNVRGGELHPHHIKAFALWPELRFAINNGITLCRECHKKTDSYGKWSKREVARSLN